jgi:hypothetical protein
MLLPAFAVVVRMAMIFDAPIFQGLAVSLMAGEIASTFLWQLAVPILYDRSKRRSEKSTAI